MMVIAPRAGGASGINSFGQVVGITTDFSSSFLWTPDSPNDNTGKLIEFSAGPSAFRTVANSISSHGQFVGFTTPNADMNRALLWTPETPNGTAISTVELGDLPGGLVSAAAQDINSLGQVIGSSTVGAVYGHTHAFLWTPNTPNGTAGSMVDLGDFPGGGDQSVAYGINSRGQVVGESYNAIGYHAFLWNPATPNGMSGSMIDLGVVPDGVERSTAYDINERGDVVGESWVSAGPHAFLWTPNSPNGSTGTMIDLNTVLNPNSGVGWTLEYARAINDSGQIVGSGKFDPDGPGGAAAVVRAFLLTPIPEPATIAIAGIGGIFLAYFQPRRLRPL